MNGKKRDSEYYRQIGRRGGKATVTRHGRNHMKQIGRKGWLSTTRRYFRSEDDHKLWFIHAGLHAMWKATGLPMKYDVNGRPIWPEKAPPHPAHDGFTEF